MDIMELGAIGELVGGVAVIASLVYVGLQVRQSNRLARTAVVKSGREATADFLKLLCSNSEMNQLYVEGFAAREGLSHERRTQFDMCMTLMFRTMESQFLEWRDGYLGDELWKTWERQATQELRHPGVVAYWKRNKDTFIGDFVQNIDGLVPDGAVA